MTQRHIVRETYEFSPTFLADAQQHFERPWDRVFPAHAVVRQVRVWTILGPRWVDAEIVCQTWRTADAAIIAFAGNKDRDTRFRFRFWLNRANFVDEMWARASYATPDAYFHSVSFMSIVRIYWDPDLRTWTISKSGRNHSMRLARSFDAAFTIADEMVA